MNSTHLSFASAPTAGKALTWKDDFSVGNEAIDALHREFLHLLEHLCLSDDDGVQENFEQIGRHLFQHFEEETALMSKFSYPVAQCHEDEHARVLDSFHEILQLADQTNRLKVMRNFGFALKDWFPAHTTYLDAPLAHWISKQRFGGKPIVIRKYTGSELKISN